MRDLQRLDLSAYVRGLAVYARNPIVALPPLVAALVQLFINPILGNMIFSGLIAWLLQGFGLSVAIIIADLGWRRGRAAFDTAWDEARRKAPDILMATLGYGFVLFAAGLVGGMIGSLGVILVAIAAGALIYTLPAAAIGGIPGGAALQISVERARSNPAATLVLAVVVLVVYFAITVGAAGPVREAITNATQSDLAASIAVAALEAVAFGYIAIVLAKVYGDISYGRRY
ncbi:MAG TPA: hypothetical protein VGD50_08065 [Candidatus Baltobacteraceae bacterium]